MLMHIPSATPKWVFVLFAAPLWLGAADAASRGLKLRYAFCLWR